MSGGAKAFELSGFPKIVDGDSLKFGGAKVRLIGIDAPEHGQLCGDHGEQWDCGKASTEHLKSLIEDEIVRCKWEKTDRYGRLLARCIVGTRSLNAAMVEDGMAIAAEFFESTYVPQQEAARKAAQGIWSGQFTTPFEWRKSH